MNRELDIDRLLGRAPLRTVVFLGAGAGISDGVASTADMAAEIRAWFGTRFHPSFARVPEATAFLRKGDPDTLATLASLVEGKRVETAPVAALLHRRLTWATAAAADYPTVGLDGNRRALLAKLKTTGGRLDVLTTNWDTSLDTIIEGLEGQVDYVLDIESTARGLLSQRKPMRFFKLNGSPTWVTCEKCHVLSEIPANTIKPDEYEITIASGRYEITVVSEDYEAKVPHCSRCGLQATHLLSLPSIGAALNYLSLELPSARLPNVTRDHATLLHLHSEALLALMSADRIVFVGYSLPPYDRAIRLLIHTALNQSSSVATQSCQITVVAKDSYTRENFLEVLGDIFFSFRDDGIESFLEDA